MLQTDFIHESYVDVYRKNNIRYTFADIGDITFLSGQRESVHRWFRLTPSYSPGLVRFMFQKLDCNEKTLVLDPFSGRGTTAIESQKAGYPFDGIEINPLLCEVANKSLDWALDVGKLQKIHSRLIADIKAQISKYKALSCDEYSKISGVPIPPIFNVFRWWQPDVLKELLIIREALRKTVPKNCLSPFWLAICSSCLDCANIHRNHPTISFDDGHTRTILPLVDFENNVFQIFDDLEQISKQDAVLKSQVHLGNSCSNLSSVISNRIDRVITSPPYPNRFSYIHTTRPQLYFMQLIDDAGVATNIDLEAIGGTWGRATSVLDSCEVKPEVEIADLLHYRASLNAESQLMCNYATKYFNMLFKHLVELKKVARKGFRGAYVVGNTRLKGVEIYTDVILAQIAERAGFKTDEIVVFRKRGGKKKLYETAVCISV